MPSIVECVCEGGGREGVCGRQRVCQCVCVCGMRELTSTLSAARHFHFLADFCNLLLAVKFLFAVKRRFRTWPDSRRIYINI